MVYFGCLSLAIATITGVANPFVPFIFGGTVCIMIYCVGPISNAHFNPAVTIAFWSLKRITPTQVLVYLAAEVSAALFACFLIGLTVGAEHRYGATSIAGPLLGGLIIEFLLTFCLMFVIVAVTDRRAWNQFAGIAIGLAVTLGALVGGGISGASMNPARTLGPAIFSGNYENLWVYMVVPPLGAVSAALFYKSFLSEKNS